jgi:hypothetical protein
MKELNESTNLAAFRMKFEACRSFDLEDDMEFCPSLLTESDVSISLRRAPGYLSRVIRGRLTSP